VPGSKDAVWAEEVDEACLPRPTEQEWPCLTMARDVKTGTGIKLVMTLRRDTKTTKPSVGYELNRAREPNRLPPVGDSLFTLLGQSTSSIRPSSRAECRGWISQKLSPRIGDFPSYLLSSLQKTSLHVFAKSPARGALRQNGFSGFDTSAC
jgi:hypothetical protein